MKKIISSLLLGLILVGCSSQVKNESINDTSKEVYKEITLHSSKEELKNIKDSICNSDGKVKYISGEIISELKPVVISMKNGDTGNIEDISIEVYEFRLITKDNISHNVFLKVESIGKSLDYKKGDIIYYNLEEGENSAWYIGEKEEVLYLIVNK